MRAWLALLILAAQAHAKTLHLEAFDGEGNPLLGPALLAHVAPRSRRPPVNGGFYVTDLDDTPATGRPWLVATASSTVLAWGGPNRVRVSFPWPVADDGFSTVVIDNEGAGYADGERILLNEAIALSQYRLFKDSLELRAGKWEPTYKPSRKAKDQQETLLEALAAAKRETEPGKRAAAYEKALTKLSAAWATMLFEHGVQTAAHPKLGPSLRWGLTLDETIVSRVSDFDDIAKKIGGSGANWVRLVFRKNPDDFTYSNPRSFLEYDALVSALSKRKVRVMASVLDSTMWSRDIDPKPVEARVRNLVMKYQDTIRSWEVASESNGDWLGGGRGALSDETVFRTISAAANAVKEIDRSLETVATLYWWEGTAPDDRHPTFAWLRRAIFDGAIKPFDVVGLSVFPDDHPMGMSFDRVFGRLRQLLPDKKLMVGAFGYVEGRELDGYWWLDPKDVDGARKDLLILYSGAGASIPAGLGGGFWWPTLQTMFDGSRAGDSLFRIYRRTLERLGR